MSGGGGGVIRVCARSVNPYSERHGKHITIANGCLLHYSTQNFTYHINQGEMTEDDGEWFADPQHH